MQQRTDWSTGHFLCFQIEILSFYRWPPIVLSTGYELRQWQSKGTRHSSRTNRISHHCFHISYVCRGNWANAKKVTSTHEFHISSIQASNGIVGAFAARYFLRWCTTLILSRKTQILSSSSSSCKWWILNTCRCGFMRVPSVSLIQYLSFVCCSFAHTDTNRKNKQAKHKTKWNDHLVHRCLYISV